MSHTGVEFARKGGRIQEGYLEKKNRWRCLKLVKFAGGTKAGMPPARDSVGHRPVKGQKEKTAARPLLNGKKKKGGGGR